MRIIPIVFLAFALHIAGMAQSSKQVREQGIQSTTTFLVDKSGNKTKDETEVFDKEGNTIELIEYNPDGTIKKHFKYTYNQNNDKLSETQLDPKGKLVKEIKYEYNGKLRTSRKEYDEKSRLTEWKSYEYQMKQ